MAKFNRTKFKTREKTEEVMHTLHSDITRPWSTPSLGGGLYVVSLVDEASSNGTVSIIKTKSAAADEIRRLILIREAKTQKKCRVLFTDRGGEYVGLELKEWCLNRRIMHHYSTPRVPQQNGRAERFNQTIANIMRSLMFTYKLHDSLWGHAMLYACMLYTIRLHKKLKMTRYEAFNGKVPNLSNFMTFGCKVYARVVDIARNKLEPKCQLGIFLDPEQDGPGYKVLTFNDKLNRDKYQVRIFRDIICYENLTVVTGVHDEDVLHWGGHINLPHGEEIIPPPPELEPLTGVPEPPADPGLQIQAQAENYLEGKGSKQNCLIWRRLGSHLSNLLWLANPPNLHYLSSPCPWTVCQCRELCSKRPVQLWLASTRRWLIMVSHLPKGHMCPRNRR
jgi:transposase InsO family protein